ncbi:MAG TPA: hypothetical protein VGH54_23960 [Mycobacterium sp.]|jgi:hypothetical protein|uniref:hypothetical protein n=1 Tax=Mycobacterium sp. TaxID=1785 RepID=UPI002F42508F
MQPLTPTLHVLATDPPAWLEQHEKERIKAAAYRARLLYPGPVGEFINRELLSWSTIGLKFDTHGVLAKTIRALLNAPLPEPPDSAQAA